MEKSLEQRIAEAVQEEIAIVNYDNDWPRLFEKEAEKLLNQFPKPLILKIQHFGSTAVQDLSAKPVIDMLVEVTSLNETVIKIVPALVSEGYDYFWRPTSGKEDEFYCWFIKRDPNGNRTHHIHMVEADSVLWDGLYFRDYLRQFPDIARKYSELKKNLSEDYTNDRIAYHEGKSEFVVSITQKAKLFYGVK